MAISTLATPEVRTAAQPDLSALKARQQGAWASGDYAVVGTTLQIVGEQLCESLDIRAGQKVLDVAAGNGNVSLAAARRFCDVISTDYVPALLARGRERAAAGVRSPALWGNRARIDEMFGAHASSIQCEPRTFAFRYRSPEHFMQVFKTYYGPILKAFGALDTAGQAALANDLDAQIDRFNRSGDGGVVVPSEYLEIVITRR